MSTKEFVTQLKPRDVYRYALGLFWSIVAAVYLFCVTFADSIPGQKYGDTIIGFLMGTIVATIINDVFGSSEGSRAKQESMSKIIERGQQ